MNVNNVLQDATSAQMRKLVINAIYRVTGFVISIFSADAKIVISIKPIINVRAAYWDALFAINLKNV
jgi:hypothetical protein